MLPVISSTLYSWQKQIRLFVGSNVHWALSPYNPACKWLSTALIVHIWLFYVAFGKPNLKPQIACKPCFLQMSLSNLITSEIKSYLFFNAAFWELTEYYCKNWKKEKICNLIGLKNEDSYSAKLLPSLIEATSMSCVDACFSCAAPWSNYITESCLSCLNSDFITLNL